MRAAQNVRGNVRFAHDLALVVDAPGTTVWASERAQVPQTAIVPEKGMRLPADRLAVTGNLTILVKRGGAGVVSTERPEIRDVPVFDTTAGTPGAGCGDSQRN